jgi:hypothetical protein
VDFVEVFGAGGRQILPLTADRMVVGKGRASEIRVEGDETLSRTHAVLERYPTGWSVRDLGSRNGTSVNGERLWGEQHLKPGDELLLGRTRIVYRSEAAMDATATTAAEGAPELTRRELDVLRALCRPLASGDVFTEPASIRVIAKELVVTDAAVKQHLTNLYDKFKIYEGGERRRVQLANEAIHRGAVAVAELRGH